VFGKILKHNVDEQFWYVQKQVGETVQGLVTARLKERYVRVS